MKKIVYSLLCLLGLSSNTLTTSNIDPLNILKDNYIKPDFFNKKPYRKKTYETLKNNYIEHIEKKPLLKNEYFQSIKNDPEALQCLRQHMLLAHNMLKDEETAHYRKMWRRFAAIPFGILLFLAGYLETNIESKTGQLLFGGGLFYVGGTGISQRSQYKNAALLRKKYEEHVLLPLKNYKPEEPMDQKPADTQPKKDANS